MPTIILAGDEEFELSRRLVELKSSLLDQVWGSMNFLRLENPGLTEITEAAASLPFGPGNRLVLIDRCELFTKKRTTKESTASNAKDGVVEQQSHRPAKIKSTSTPEAFEEALASIFERTYLIFSCPYNFDSTLKISKSAVKFAEIEMFTREKHFPGSKNPKLETWCRKEAKRYGATIEDAVIEYLLEGTEANLRQISSEIQKAAIALLPKTHITYDLILKLSPHQSHVFAFADRWINNRVVEALASLAELTAQQNAMPILAAVQTMLSKWIKIKILAEDFNNSLSAGGVARKELPFPELAKRVAAELKLMPFSVEKDLKRLSKRNSAELIARQVMLTHLELLIKTGQMPDKHALELFVMSG